MIEILYDTIISSFFPFSTQICGRHGMWHSLIDRKQITPQFCSLFLGEKIVSSVKAYFSNTGFFLKFMVSIICLVQIVTSTIEFIFSFLLQQWTDRGEESSCGVFGAYGTRARARNIQSHLFVSASADGGIDDSSRIKNASDHEADPYLPVNNSPYSCWWLSLAHPSA